MEQDRKIQIENQKERKRKKVRAKDSEKESKIARKQKVTEIQTEY